MRKKCIISYDGTNFNGYQAQPKNQRTVQGEFEKALFIIHKKKEIISYASGRTDAGVHAHGQVLHFDTDLNILNDRWIVAMNTLLPKDIRLKQVEDVSEEFHARYDAVKKEYRYNINVSEIEDVFRRYYSYHYPYKMDFSRIDEAISYLIGTHDFTAFCSKKTSTNTKIRSIYHISYECFGDEIIFRFIGNGFLHNMVRILVGTLLEIGQGRKMAADIPSIIESKNRKKAGPTAPGHGLYLWKVDYK